ncbi:MAG TPA: nucleoside phosphorylase [Thermotogota bacterium]|nr:nucleoside phosphorylase [Thermotogota bacterium]
MENPTYHIQIEDRQKVGRYVLLPGDRGRVKRMAKYLENPEIVGDNREYFTMTGYLKGEKVSVMSTGMGAPCISIGVEEIRTLGSDTFIRVGTTGALQPFINLGDSIIATAAVRSDGTMDYYVPKEFPAVADFMVISNMKRAAEIIDQPHHLGIVHSTDSYYGRNFDPNSAMAYSKMLAKANVLAVEMEISALYVLGSLYSLRTGAILTTREARQDLMEEYQQAGEEFERGMEKSIQIAFKAIELMIEKDRA